MLQLNTMENLEAEKRSPAVPSSASGKCDNLRDTCLASFLFVIEGHMLSKLSVRNHTMHYDVHYTCLFFHHTLFIWQELLGKVEGIKQLCLKLRWFVPFLLRM